ncbi:hypothetical protein WH5701_16740 [Synechococcus sp. WH 5701]|nr:hypothetical protein WH5701_16740 [Synechococcus sp. WH 5701]
MPQGMVHADFAIERVAVFFEVQLRAKLFSTPRRVAVHLKGFQKNRYLRVAIAAQQVEGATWG